MSEPKTLIMLRSFIFSTEYGPDTASAAFAPFAVFSSAASVGQLTTSPTTD